MQLSRETLKEWLSYDPETGIFRWRKTVNGQARAGGIAGNDKGLGYIRIVLKFRKYYAHRLAWLYVYGEWPSDRIDHINGNPSDNRISNLRIATHSQNMCNSRKRSDNTVGFKGVYKHNQTGRYVANIFASGRKYHLGCFDTPEDAHKAYVKAAERLHGEFARTEGGANV